MLLLLLLLLYLLCKHIGKGNQISYHRISETYSLRFTFNELAYVLMYDAKQTNKPIETVCTQHLVFFLYQLSALVQSVLLISFFFF